MKNCKIYQFINFKTCTQYVQKRECVLMRKAYWRFINNRMQKEKDFNWKERCIMKDNYNDKSYNANKDCYKTEDKNNNKAKNASKNNYSDKTENKSNNKSNYNKEY